MEFGAWQQLLNNLPAPPTTKRWPRRRPAASSARAAAWPCCGHPAAVGLLLCRWSRRRHSVLPATHADRSSEEVICLKNIIQDRKLPRAGKFFELVMTVRDCELDMYGVVNNAVYGSYIETARQQMSASLGVTGLMVSTGRALALSQLNVKYIAPLKRGDKFVVMVRIVQIKGTRILLEHLIATLPNRKLVLEAMATVVCLNEDYRPTRMLPEITYLSQFFSHPSN